MSYFLYNNKIRWKFPYAKKVYLKHKTWRSFFYQNFNFWNKIKFNNFNSLYIKRKSYFLKKIKKIIFLDYSTFFDWKKRILKESKHLKKKQKLKILLYPKIKKPSRTLRQLYKLRRILNFVTPIINLKKKSKKSFFKKTKKNQKKHKYK